MTVDGTGKNTDTQSMVAIEHLLRLSEAYVEATGVEGKTLSWRVFGDSKKLDALQTGSDIQVRRYEGAMRWFADNWPENGVWPAGVPMPEPVSSEAGSDAAA